MLHLLTCSRGHSWEATAADGAVGRAVCPVCGDAIDLLPLLDLAPSAEAITAAPAPVLPQAPPLRDAAGRPVVAGFDIVEDLGRTPLGVRLFRAKQLLVNRPVLLKVVVARDDAGQMGWGSLRGEAAALGRLRHPNLMAIWEAGERERQLFYNAVEWAEGPTLAEHAAAKPLPPRPAARLVEVLARAVHMAHEQGVVHRGLRPSCVRLQPQPGAGEGKRREVAVELPFWLAGAARVLPRISGFGLARRPVEGDAADLELHDGPPAYLSPEQAWGRAARLGRPATFTPSAPSSTNFSPAGRRMAAARPARRSTSSAPATRRGCCASTSACRPIWPPSAGRPCTGGRPIDIKALWNWRKICGPSPMAGPCRRGSPGPPNASASGRGGGRRSRCWSWSAC